MINDAKCDSSGRLWFGNRKVVFNFIENNIKPPLPDGLTIDKDGKLWIAVFSGYEVLRIDPESGKLMERVAIPASQVTSVAWGGANLEHLYVTTANMHPKEKPPILDGGTAGPDDGSTFRISGLSTSGLPMHSFNL